MSEIKINAEEHPIKSVTIFKSSKAEVVRIFNLQLKDGSNKVQISGLPSTIDTHSVRVSGLGDARLFDVVCTIRGDTEDESSPTEAIRLLKVKKYALESEKRVREHESELLVNYSKTLTGEHVKPETMSEFLQTFVEQGRKNLEALESLNEKVVQVDRQIASAVRKLALKKGQALGEATVIIGVEGETTVDLKLTYIVSNASWEPTYELHAKTASGKPSSSVSLHYGARIVQSTGEDWSNAALTLNTVASDTMAKAIPKLTTLRLKQRMNGFRAGNKGFGAFGVPTNNAQNLFGQPQQQQQVAHQQQVLHQAAQLQQQQQQQQLAVLRPPALSFGPQTNATPAFAGFGSTAGPAATSLFGSAAGSSGGLFGSTASAPLGDTPDLPAASVEDTSGINDGFEEIGVPAPFAEPMTVVSESPLSISYSVEGKCSIPSDGEAHKVSVAILPFEAKVTYVSVPRLEPQVYLDCEVKNASEYRLLPGPVNVIFDDSFVSKTTIQDINSGDTFNCSLGADPSTKISYIRTSKTVKDTTGSFVEATNTTTYTTKITVHNKHQFAISQLVIRDAIPLAEDKRVRVLLREPAGLADAKDGEVVDLKKGDLKVKWSEIVDGKGGEKEGKFVWVTKVEAGAQAKMEAKWEVKAPSDLNLIEMFDWVL